MEFRILGGLEIASGEHQLIHVSRPLVRATIFVLVLYANKSTTSERLIDLLWGAQQRDMSHALRNCIWGARKVVSPERLVTDDVGYRLNIDPDRDQIDLDQFRVLHRRGQEAHNQGDYARAADLLERARALWRAPSLGDLLPKTNAMGALITGLQQERLGARDVLIQARLALGHHRELLPELRTLAAQEPLNEHLRGQLMIALYRSGLAADALHTFEEGCAALREAAVTEPGAELQRIRRLVIDGAPWPEPAPTPGVAEASYAVPAIRQLPPDVMGFAGRACELADLIRLLTAAESPTAVPVAEVVGPPGVGKTCLAVHVAHAAQEFYPDGQLYLQLAGRSPHPCDPGEILGEILPALGVRAMEVPTTTEQRSAMYRSRLAGRRILVLVDDASSAEQVRPLLPGTAGSAAIITSRSQLGVLSDAKVIGLEPFGPIEGLRMLANIIGESRVAAERVAAESVVSSCGGLPLAVRIAGARLAARPSRPVAHLATLLADERHRLDHLVAGDLAVRASFALSYMSLDQRAQRAFRLLALAGPHDVTSWVVSLLLGEDNADDVLETLVDRSLLAAVGVDIIGHPRYRLHDLLRDYAGELLADYPEYEIAQERLISGWLELVDCADVHIPREPYFPEPSRYPRHGMVDESIKDMVSAAPQTWLGVERINILGVIERACAAGKYRLATGLALRLAAFLHLRNHHEDAESMWSLVAEAAERADDTHVAAQARFRAAVVIAVDRGQHALARPEVESCIAAFEARGDVRNLARALALRAFCRLGQGQHSPAQSDAERGIELARAAGDPHAEFSCLRILGLTLSRLHHHDRAAQHCEMAVTIARRLNEESYVRIAMYALIQVLVRAERYDLVPTLYQQGLDLSAAADDKLCRAYFLQQMGTAQQGLGQYESAVEKLSAALEIFESHHRDRATALCHRQIAQCLEATENPPTTHRA